MKTCVKCGNQIKEKDAIYFDSPVSHPTRYICPCCAEEEGIEKEEEGIENKSDEVQMSKRVIWVLMEECTGYVLFHGNPNPDCPPYQIGDISNLLYGRKLVWGYKKWEVEKQFNKKAWRKRFQSYKIKAKKIVIGYEPYKKSEVQ